MPSEFLDMVLELLEPLGGVTARRMFGGHGLFQSGLMFGLMANDTLYLKADDVNRPDFEAAGMGPFTYSRKGRDIALGYHETPAELYDDGDAFCDWARAAYDAALRSRR